MGGLAGAEFDDDVHDLVGDARRRVELMGLHAPKAGGRGRPLRAAWNAPVAALVAFITGVRSGAAVRVASRAWI